MTDQPQEYTPLATTIVGLQILVVDDDSDLCRALSWLLRSAGFRVVTFPSAEALLAEDLVALPACMVFDIHLAGISGLELAREVTIRGWNVPIIFITARDDALTREQAKRAGAVAFLPKPFEGEALIRAIESAACS